MCYMHFYIACVVYRKVNLKEKGAHLNQFVTLYLHRSFHISVKAPFRSVELQDKQWRNSRPCKCLRLLYIQLLFLI